jgi:hypothetical protein
MTSLQGETDEPSVIKTTFQFVSHNAKVARFFLSILYRRQLADIDPYEGDDLQIFACALVLLQSCIVVALFMLSHAFITTAHVVVCSLCY